MTITRHVSQYQGGRILIRKLLLTVTFITGISVSAADTTVVGYVQHVRGSWIAKKANCPDIKLEENTLIQSGYSLSRGSDTGEITVVLSNGQRMLCPAEDTCGKPIVINSSVTNRVVEAVLSIFPTNAGRFKVSQSLGQHELRERVVTTTAEGAVMLSGVFQNEQKVPLTLTIRSIDNGDLVKAKCKWNPSSQTAVSDKPIRSGLYEARLLDTVENVPSGDSAWILVVPETDFANYENRLQECFQLTSSWQRATESEKRVFWRMYLESLSKKLQI